MRTSPAGKTRASQKGFTYAAVLAAVVIVGIAAEVAHLSTTRIVQAERETELLFRGQAYLRAIASYHRANRAYPRALGDLLDDPRSPARRHIRALYLDPMAREAEQGWHLIRSSDGGIAGVASRSSGRPLKAAHFPAGLEGLAGAAAYSEWVFEYAPAAASGGTSAGPSEAPLSPGRRPYARAPG